MTAITVTPDALIDAAALAAGRATEIEASLSALGSQIHGLTASWQGVAQTQFLTLYEQWQTSARSLNEALTGISRLLDAAGIAYQESEASIARMFSGI